MKKNLYCYFGTFGTVHTKEDGESLEDYYVVLIAETQRQARILMFNEFGKEWSSVYPLPSFLATYYVKGVYKILTQKD